MPDDSSDRRITHYCGLRVLRTTAWRIASIPRSHRSLLLILARDTAPVSEASNATPRLGSHCTKAIRSILSFFFPNHVRARRWPMSCMPCAGLLRTYPSVMMVALRSCTAIARPAGQLLSSPLIAKDLSVPPFSMGRHCRIGLGNRASIRHELQADFWAEPGLPILLPILAMADSTAHGSFRI